MGSKNSDIPSSIVLYNALIAAIEGREALDTVARAYASYVLACNAGNKSAAADKLQIDRRTLHRWETERKRESIG